MDASEFRKRGREMVDYIADYMVNIRSRPVTPEVEPGYIRTLLPAAAPKKGEEWETIMADLERAVMPGITHWQHPNFHAYFASGNSFPSILADMLSDVIGCIGFSWAASPACVELETLMLDWIGQMIGLPNRFLHTSGQGGGVIQAHSCVEKAGMIGFVKMRHLDVDEKFSLRGHVLEDAIEEDKKLGLIPFFVCATLGTTACCSFDNLQELGDVCTRHGVYLHVDAAYAGNALICPEFQFLIEGVENVDSFGFNTNKWLQVNFDCSLMWVKSVETLTTALTVDPLYLQHRHGDKAIDLRHWGIPLSRRFRALKLWFVIRTYGLEGLQKRIREHCRLAKEFEEKILSDNRFELLGDVTMGLVCFRLRGPNTLTQRLLKTVNDSGKLHMVPALLNEHYIIRFALCTEYACDDDITYAWHVITSTVDELLHERQRCDSNKEEGNLCDLDIESDENTFAAFEDEIIFDNQRDHLQRAQVMRSLFFKMVSDPKCYNPRVLRSLSRPVSTHVNRPVSTQVNRPVSTHVNRPVSTHVNSRDDDSLDELCKEDRPHPQTFSQFLHCDLGYPPADPHTNRPHKNESPHNVPHNKVEENLMSFKNLLDQPKCRQILSDDGQRKITKHLRKVDELLSINKNDNELDKMKKEMEHEDDEERDKDESLTLSPQVSSIQMLG